MVKPKTKIKITVYTNGSEHFASRTFPENMPDFSPEGTVFTSTEEVSVDEVSAFEERVKQECRKRGITRVINLD